MDSNILSLFVESLGMTNQMLLDCGLLVWQKPKGSPQRNPNTAFGQINDRCDD